MYCKYCGNQIPDNSTFCAFCGKPINNNGIETPKIERFRRDVSGNNAMQQISQKPLLSTRSNARFVLLGVVYALICAFGVFGILSTSDFVPVLSIVKKAILSVTTLGFAVASISFFSHKRTLTITGFSLLLISAVCAAIYVLLFTVYTYVKWNYYDNVLGIIATWYRYPGIAVDICCYLSVAMLSIMLILFYKDKVKSLIYGMIVSIIPLVLVVCKIARPRFGLYLIDAKDILVLVTCVIGFISELLNPFASQQRTKRKASVTCVLCVGISLALLCVSTLNMVKLVQNKNEERHTSNYSIWDNAHYFEPILVYANDQDITSCKIVSGMYEIAPEAFLGCKKLTHVVIPESMLSIRYRAFFGCDSLTDVYYSGSEEQWRNIQIDPGNDDLINANIHFEQQ